MTAINAELFSQLRELRLSDKEARIYLYLTEAGGGSVQGIAKHTKISRPTVYFVLDSLLARNLVAQESKRGSKIFRALSPNSLLEEAVENRKDAFIRERIAKDVLDLLNPFFSDRPQHKPLIQLYEGEEAVIKMLFQSLETWDKSMRTTDDIWWGYQDADFVTTYRSFLEHYWKLKRKEQKVRLFSNESEKEKTISVPNRVIRAVPKNFKFKSTFWICGEFLVVLMHKNNPPYAFQIQDGVLASNVRTVFQLLWHATEATNA